MQEAYRKEGRGKKYQPGPSNGRRNVGEGACWQAVGGKGEEEKPGTHPRFLGGTWVTRGVILLKSRCAG